MTMHIPFTGELAALGAAFFWATAAVLFRGIGVHIPPLVLNFLKGIVALSLLIPTVALRGEILTSVDPLGLFLLLLSGIVGIGLGDTAFFASLNRLGERQTVLVVETLAPPLAVIIAWVALHEILPPQGFFGIAMTVAGVGWVIAERTSRSQVHDQQLRSGIHLGLMAALFQAVGAVLSRGALVNFDISPLMSTLVRLIGGTLVLVFLIPIRGQSFFPKGLRSGRVWGPVIVATVLGTYLGLLFQQISFKFTSAGIAQALLGTSALFVLPYVILRGERVSFRAFLGALVAVCGICILFSLK